MYFKPEPFDTMHPAISHTLAVDSESMHIGHQFSVPLKNSNVLSCLQNFSDQIWAAIGVALACIGGWLLLANLLDRRLAGGLRPAAVRVARQTFDAFALVTLHDAGDLRTSFGRHRQFPLLVSSMCFVLAVMLQATIKTEKVSLVDGFLLRTLEDVRDSRRRVLWMRNERPIEVFGNAPAGSLRRQIWNKPKVLMPKSALGTSILLGCHDDCVGFLNILYL